MKKQLLSCFECLENQFIPWAGRKGWSKAHWSQRERSYWLHWVLVQPLWNRSYNWIYAVIIFQQSRCLLPLQELVSVSSKTPRQRARAGGCTQWPFGSSCPPAEEELARMSLRGTDQRTYGYRCGKLMCLQWVAWKLMQLHRDVGVFWWGASSPFGAAHLLLASCSPCLVFTQVKL